MELRTEYILKKELITYLLNNDIKTNIKRVNTLLNNYNTYNFIKVKNIFIQTNNLIYTNINKLNNKYQLITYKEFKELVTSFITSRIIEDIEFIINFV